ncbi:phage major capsid protein, partial [Klebsiella pneumoniae]|uniref:phage major capsid protein n=1 Tax=Klebsiella pneumoniae TaxID=573 RepID=UPI003F7AB263
ITPSVAEQEGQQTETEATGAPQKHHYTLNQQVGSITDEADAKAWYLMAAKGTDTIEVAYLNGVDTPYIDQQEGFTTDGIATKVRIDAGVAPLDYRGLVKSSGQ